METVEEDLDRFAGHHSWYKHLSPYGEKYYMVLKKGRQPRLGTDEITDLDNEHWWFYSEEKCDSQGIPKLYPVTLNCFTRCFSDDWPFYDISTSFQRFPIECSDYLAAKYPFYRDRKGKATWDLIYRQENKEQLEQARSMARRYMALEKLRKSKTVQDFVDRFLDRIWQPHGPMSRRAFKASEKNKADVTGFSKSA